MNNITQAHTKKINDVCQQTETFLAKGGKITMLDHGGVSQFDEGFKSSEKRRLERLNERLKNKADSK